MFIQLLLPYLNIVMFIYRSNKIAELLVRCCVEIEAISKDLYLSNGGTIEKKTNGEDKHPRFDTDCLAYLESKWLLSKKIVYTSSSNFYFTKEENKTLTPLYKAYEWTSKEEKDDECKWKRAYQAVKHNRSQNIKDANVKNLIHAMAALYLLNIYYMDEEPKHIGTIANGKKIITAAESSLFLAKKAKANLFGTSDETFDDCVYIQRNIDTSERDRALQRAEPCSTEEKQNFEEIGDFVFHSHREIVLNKNKETSPPDYLWSKSQTLD